MSEILEEELYPPFEQLEGQEDESDEDFWGRCEDEEEDWDCSNCGPWCNEWGGDNICNIDCEQLGAQTEDYLKNHHRESICPVCRDLLDEYDVKTDKLWAWPGDWYDVRIGLFEVYAAYDCPKQCIHAKDNIYHCWFGSPDGPNRLIKLIGKENSQ